MERGLTTIRDWIIGDRVFQIPDYQRNYSWGEKQWEDLWDDLFYLNSDRRHYFGTLIINKTSREIKSELKSFQVYELIDGQQRVVTTLILIREIILQLASMGDKSIKKEQLNDLEKDYLKYNNVYKLMLLGTDEKFFKQHIIDNKTYPVDVLTPSQRKLLEAKKFFKNYFEKYSREYDRSTFREFLLNLKQKIDNMEIIIYEVSGETDAILIFETVNDRGKPLTNLEKSKSFLMHTIYQSANPDELKNYLSQINESFFDIFKCFEGITDTEHGEGLKEDDIQRYHYIIYEAAELKEVSHQYLIYLKEMVRNLYRENPISSLDYAMEYSKDLEKAFFALKEIVIYNKRNKLGEILKRIFALGRIANFLPLLIATWIRFVEEKEKVLGILNLIEVMAFRVYAIGKRRADTGEGRLNLLAYNIHNGKIEYDEVIDGLENLISNYENDEDFERDLKSENFHERVEGRDKKFLFFEYEKFLRKQSKEPLDIELEDILRLEYEIEHIWASEPSKLDLSEKLLEIHSRCKNKLGNLTIAPKSWNSGWGNIPFKDKKKGMKGYSNSSLRVQRELSNFRLWGEKQIEERENQIIEFALDRWRI